MKRNLVIIKLGGSVITDKSKGHGAFRKAIVKRLISEIVEAKRKKDFDLILIHGAGSYPHFLTKKYRLNDGFLGKKSSEGFSRVKLELAKLNALIWKECLLAGLAVCTVSVTSVVSTKSGKIKSFDMRAVEGLLALGIVPILHGDDSLDESGGVSVLSGDLTMSYLADKLKADKVIFVADVDGVFDKNPKVYRDARLIREINAKNFNSVVDSMRTFNKNDASGEMKGKILAIKEGLSGINVTILGGFVQGTLKASLLGKKVGTFITF